jgi:hypothetical protein
MCWRRATNTVSPLSRAVLVGEAPVVIGDDKTSRTRVFHEKLLFSNTVAMRENSGSSSEHGAELA